MTDQLSNDLKVLVKTRVFGATFGILSVAAVTACTDFFDLVSRNSASRNCALADLASSGVEPNLDALTTRYDDLLPSEPTETKKAKFIATVLPHVLRVNAEIERDRRLVSASLDCQRRGIALDPVMQAKVDSMADRYKAEDLEGLYKRMDIVPPSMAVAQSAIESGWGTSRYVLEGNALFGQYVDPVVGGMQPAGLGEESKIRLANFASMEASVRSYVNNLNTHPAYQGFRERRAAMRQEGKQIEGYALATTLQRYSQRGAAYVWDVQTIIRQNDLDDFDGLHWGGSAGEVAFATPGS